VPKDAFPDQESLDSARSVLRDQVKKG